MDTNLKAEWKKRNFKKYKYPPEKDYELFEELTLPDGGIIARIEQFKVNDQCFYATTPVNRSGCMNSYEAAKRWCEHNSGNKIN